MFPSTQSPLTLSKIIGGLSHSLNIVKRCIPIYESAKPMIANAKNAYNKITSSSTKQIKPIKKVVMNNNNFNNPTFFK